MCLYLINYSEGKPTERLCADGMVFNDYSSSEEKCDLPYNIDCSKRSKLREYICTYVCLVNIIVKCL